MIGAVRGDQAAVVIEHPATLGEMVNLAVGERMTPHVQCDQARVQIILVCSRRLVATKDGDSIRVVKLALARGISGR